MRSTRFPLGLPSSPIPPCPRPLPLSLPTHRRCRTFPSPPSPPPCTAPPSSCHTGGGHSPALEREDGALPGDLAPLGRPGLPAGRALGHGAVWLLPHLLTGRNVRGEGEAMRRRGGIYIYIGASCEGGEGIGETWVCPSLLEGTLLAWAAPAPPRPLHASTHIHTLPTPRYATQIYNHAKTQIPDLEGQIADGDFKHLKVLCVGVCGWVGGGGKTLADVAGVQSPGKYLLRRLFPMHPCSFIRSIFYAEALIPYFHPFLSPRPGLTRTSTRYGQSRA